jgi:hypothetical protein
LILLFKLFYLFYGGTASLTPLEGVRGRGLKGGGEHNIPFLKLLYGDTASLTPLERQEDLSPNFRTSNPGFNPGFTPPFYITKAGVNPGLNPGFAVLRCEP